MIVTRVVSGVVQPVVRGASGVGYGPEKILNGDFSSDTIWTKGAGWTIVAGKAVRIADLSSSAISQPVAFIAGHRYLVTFAVELFVAGLFAAQFTGGSTRNGTSRMANGTYSEILLANAGNTAFRIFASNVTIGNIDNVSVREVL